MKREAFLRELRAVARKRGIEFRVEADSGKSSHYAVSLGNKSTVVKSGGLKPVYVKIVKK